MEITGFLPASTGTFWTRCSVLLWTPEPKMFALVKTLNEQERILWCSHTMSPRSISSAKSAIEGPGRLLVPMNGSFKSAGHFSCLTKDATAASSCRAKYHQGGMPSIKIPTHLWVEWVNRIYVPFVVLRVKARERTLLQGSLPK